MAFSIQSIGIPKNDVQRNLGIARGDWENLSHINKFGFSDSVGSTFQTVWDGNNVYSYPATAGTVQITSGSGSDTGAVITVEGLDSNYDVASEDITVAGARSDINFIRVFRAFVKTPASGQTTNVGIITLLHTQADSTDTTVAKILAGAGQTLMAVYTVPRKYKAYILKFQGSIGKQKEAVFRGRFRSPGGAFRTGGQWGTFGVPVTYDYPVPLVFTQKTDFEVQVKASATTEAGALFDIILEKLP
jgi:hypothetical protein